MFNTCFLLYNQFNMNPYDVISLCTFCIALQIHDAEVGNLNKKCFTIRLKGF